MERGECVANTLVPRPSIIPNFWQNDYLRPITTGLTDLARTIADGVKSIVNYINTLIQDTADIIDIVTSVEVNLDDLFGWLPASVFATLLAGFAVVILYKIVGRS